MQRKPKILFGSRDCRDATSTHEVARGGDTRDFVLATDFEGLAEDVVHVFGGLGVEPFGSNHVNEVRWGIVFDWTRRGVRIMAPRLYHDGVSPHDTEVSLRWLKAIADQRIVGA